MNTNIILDGFNAMLKQLIASAVAEAVKPLQDRITALEINQTLVSSAKINLADLVTELVDGHDFISRSDVVVLVEEAIGNHDFSDIDISGAIEEGIENYDFSDIIEENMPGIVKDRVQEMIDEALDNLVITRN